MRGLCADSARQFWTVGQSAAACPIFRHTVKAGTVFACCGVVWGQIWTKFWQLFFGVFCCCTRPSWCPECAPCVGLHGGAAVRLIKISKGSKKNSKRAKKELDFLKIDFLGPTFEAWYFKMFDGTDFANSSPLMRYERASNCFFGDPHHNLNYSVTKCDSVTLSH